MNQIRLSKQYRHSSSPGPTPRPSPVPVVAKTPAVVIPSGWTEVLVSPDPSAHVQATGRDVRGRKQYRYHPDWHTAQVEFKCERLQAFAQALPQLKARVETDLRGPGLPKAKVAAALVRLLELALLGVGQDQRAPRESEARVGNDHVIDVQDRHRTRVVKRWQELPRQVSFHYLDEQDERCVLAPADLEEYMGAGAGEKFSAKELRAWAGSAFTTRGRVETEAIVSTRALDHEVLGAATPLARRLGKVALRSGDATVPVAVIEAHVRGSLARTRRGEPGLEVPLAAGVGAPASRAWTAVRPTRRPLGERRAPALRQDVAKAHDY